MALRTVYVTAKRNQQLATIVINRGPTGPGGGGDMLSATYDPQGIEGDAFDMANMTEGADAKVLTAAERNAIAALGTASTREADQDLRTTDAVEFDTVTADTVNLHTAAFDTTNGGPTSLGEMAWDSVDGTLDIQVDGGVKIAVGEDGLIRVRNTSGATIAKGAPLVYAGTTGASGKLEVGPWIGANVTNVRTFLGFAAGAIANNTDGYAVWFGKIKEIDTDGGAELWNDGDIIYAIPSASSTLSNIAPTSGDYVTAAVVINAGSGTSGSLFSRPTFDTVAPTLGTAASVDADQNLRTDDDVRFSSIRTSGATIYGLDDGSGNTAYAQFAHTATGDLTISTESTGTGTAGNIILDATQNIGIGTSSPTAKLQVENLAINGSSSYSGVNCSFRATTAGTTNVTGLNLQIEQKSATGSQTNFVGLNSISILGASNVTTGTAIGAKGQVRIAAPLDASSDSIFGLVGDFTNGHFPTLDSASIAGVASTMVFDYNPTSTNANTKISGFMSTFRGVRAGQLPRYSGFYFENPRGVTTGSIDDVFGIYLEQPTIGSNRNFGIYSVGGDNFFGGNVGIGTDSPARKLHVTDAMRLDPTTTPASPSAGDIYFDSSTNKLRCYDGTAWNDLF